MGESSYDIIIVGGGTAGICVAARLRRADKRLRIAIVDPATKHYYQPLWTLVGAGLRPLDETEREMGSLIPEGVDWIFDRVTGFLPEDHQVQLQDKGRLSYDQLVVAPGIQVNMDAIPGLAEAIANDQAGSNYTPDAVLKTDKLLQRFKGGRAVFTFPNTPIKCGGAPQKIMWLAEEIFRKKGIREQSEIVYAPAGKAIFGLEHYRVHLQELVERRGIVTRFRHNLVEVRGSQQIAVFEQLDTGEHVEIDYDFLHATPPQSAPDFVAHSPLADPRGWIDVHRNTTQHVRYPDIFGLGDASNMPCAKTGAAIRKQAPVAVANIVSRRAGEPLRASYNGYASCPIITNNGRVILAEFGYDGEIMESFPIDQRKERYSAWLLKAHALPILYWEGMMKGLA